MKILYLSYWGLNEGLTDSSVLPHLNVLSGKAYIEEIHFVTLERDHHIMLSFDAMDKVTHHPLYSKNIKPAFVNKINDMFLFGSKLESLIKDHSIDRLICRTSLAGALGYSVFKKTKVPFIVESFEPHADYMLDAQVWEKNGLKYRFQKYWERMVVKYAEHVVTVSRHFTNELQEKYGRRTLSFGCGVDTKRFAFESAIRKTLRQELELKDQTVGIYVGKFGSIYLEDDAFHIFRAAFDFYGSAFSLLILSPNDPDWIKEKLSIFQVPSDRTTIRLVPHAEVPGYLSASDFAFSMVRPAPVRLHCSPIKDGEYWANGLPILSADGIGEDSEIIRSENAGAIFTDDLSNLKECFERISELIQSENRTGRIADIASKYRSFDGLSGLYDEVLKGPDE